MILRVQSVNFTAKQELIDFVEKKLSKLDQYYDNIVDGEVFLKLDNSHDKQNKIAEIKLNLPGSELVVKKQSSSFEEATDLGTEALRRQLTRHKERVRGV
jgi:putative sigma-54 modulation protein